MGIFSDKIRVGVLRGGPSHEYEVSLNTGASVLESLDRNIYDPVDIYISRQGAWHESGFERPIERILKNTDVVFNALHGEYGEDGTVQKILDKLSIPYTGSGAIASVLGMNKVASKKLYNMGGLKTPFSFSINMSNLSNDDFRQSVRRAYKTVPNPFVIKPALGGSSVGVSIVNSLPELEEGVAAAFEYSPTILIEEFIGGKEATCGVVDDFRGAEHHALMPIEIRPRVDGGFFDYNSKYSDPSSPLGADEICPGDFSEEEKRQLEQMAVIAHQLIGARHYSRSDFRIHPKRGIFILETNTLPGLTKTSLIPKALQATGTKLSLFLHHVISLAMGKK